MKYLIFLMIMLGFMYDMTSQTLDSHCFCYSSLNEYKNGHPSPNYINTVAYSGTISKVMYAGNIRSESSVRLQWDSYFKGKYANIKMKSSDCDCYSTRERAVSMRNNKFSDLQNRFGVYEDNNFEIEAWNVNNSSTLQNNQTENQFRNKVETSTSSTNNQKSESVKVAESKNNDATIQEAIEFIQAKHELTPHVGYRSRNYYDEAVEEGDYSYYYNVSMNFNECECKISYTKGRAKYGRREKDKKYIYTFNFKDLSPKNTIIKKRTCGCIEDCDGYFCRSIDGYDQIVYHLNIGTYNDRELIDNYYSRFNKTYDVNSMDIMWSADKSMLERVGKAINHLIKECGGKSEKF